VTTKTLEELQELHSEMLATASDLGLEVPEDLKMNFTDQSVGATVCSNLDALIREHRAKGEVAADQGEAHNGAASPSEPAEPAPRAKKPRRAKPAAEPKQEKEPMPSKTTKSKARGKVKGKTTGKRPAFAADAKITWTGKDNPARAGSGRHKRIEGVRKASGKTVDKYQQGGGRAGTLGWCVKRGLVKVG